MNWVLIAVLLVLIISAAVGYSKGMLRIAYSMVAWIMVLVFVSWATPHINLYLLENTLIYERIESHCEESIRLSANEQVRLEKDDEPAEQLELEKGDEPAEQLEEDEELENLVISVPDTVVEGILEKTSGVAGELLEESGAYSAVAEGLANFVIEGISFMTALVAAWILVHIISQLLGIVSHIPIIKGTNRFLGLFVGAIYGLLLVWLVFYGVALASTGETGQIIVSYIYDNPFLTFLYENNLVLTLILKYF